MGFISKYIAVPRIFATGLLLMAAQAFAQTTTLTIHLYSPWAADPARNAPPAFIEMVGSGAPIPFRDNIMVAEGADWYKVSITYTGTQDQNKHHAWTFINYIPDPTFRWAQESRYTSDGTTGGPPFNLGTVFFDKKLTEVWIIPQGPGKPPIIQDYPPAKKVLYFFNPWPMAAPSIKQGAAVGYKSMRLPDPRGPSRCGWYVHYFTDSAFTVHFKHIRTPQVYGQGGLNDTKVIDLTAAFKTADTVYLYPEFEPGGPAKTSGVYTGKSGTCGYNMGVTVRDFSNSHPDFNKAYGAPGYPNLPDVVTKNMVQSALGVDNKPVFNLAPKPHPLMTATNTWFNTDSTVAGPTRNYQTCRDIPISKDDNGYWAHSSLDQSPSKSFFPIDDWNRHGDPGFTNCVDKDYKGGACNFDLGDKQLHNFLFCMEMHAEFTYEKGQTFAFIGDDDVWVFINKKLAIDLGGTHSPARDSVLLDAQGLVEGQKYPFDLFYCERQRNGSNLYIRTSIYFEQASSVYAEKVPGAKGTVTYNIKERLTEGGGYCGSTGPTTKVVDAPSKFMLQGPSVNPAQELAPGLHYQGLTIGATLMQVVVDTAKIKGLTPGLYTLTFFSKSTNQSDQITFTVPAPLLPPVEIPTANPPGNTKTTLEPPVVVTLSTATPGATILYTTDGTTPDTTVRGTTRLYVPGTTVLSFTATTTLKAIGVGPGRLPSPVMSETYTRIGPPVAEMPKANPPGNSRTTLEPPVVVTLSTGTPGAVIFYTTDGTVPDTAARGTTRQYVPGTTVLSFTSTVNLKALAVAPGYAPSAVMTETYTRVGPPTAATPVATPSGRRFIEPLTVTLETLTPGATILYSTDGNDPDTVVTARTKAYNGPMVLSQSTVIKAIAVIPGMLKSGLLTETYDYAPPVAIKGGAVLDKDGDGRIETVSVEFAGPLSVAPERMVLKIQTGDGQVHERTVTRAKNEISLVAGPSNRVVVNLSTPLPFGATSVSAAGSAGQVFRQEDIPLLDGTFPLADSAGPVILKTEVHPVDSLNPQKRVVITFSEVVTLPAQVGSAFVFKREGEEFAAGQVLIARADVGPTSVTLYVDELSPFFPIVGDSVALAADGVAETARAKDALGNAPTRKLFRRMEGTVPKATPPTIYVTFADGSRTAGPGSRAGSEATSPPDVLFIPVDSKAMALPGSALDGKCAGCFTGSEGNFVGPVVHLEIPGPSTFDLTIFNNLGEFVAAGKGSITESDLRLLTPIKGGAKYMARVVWTGRTAHGRKAGTGAYVLSAQVRAEKDLKSGAPATTGSRTIRFGMLRAQSGS